MSRELRTFYDAEGRPYVMPVDIDPEHWAAMDRLYAFTEVGDEFEWVGAHPDELRPVLPLVAAPPALPLTTFTYDKRTDTLTEMSGDHE